MTDVIVRIARRKSAFLDPDLPGILPPSAKFSARAPVTLGGILRRRQAALPARRFEDGRIDGAGGPAALHPCVDLSTGYALIFHSTPRPLHLSPKIRQMRRRFVADAMGASSAVPAVFAPMRCLRQAACRRRRVRTSPVDLLLAYGERNVVAIDIGEPYSPPMCPRVFFEIASHSLSVLSEHLKECNRRARSVLLIAQSCRRGRLFTFDLNGGMSRGGLSRRARAYRRHSRARLKKAPPGLFSRVFCANLRFSPLRLRLFENKRITGPAVQKIKLVRYKSKGVFVC